MAKDQIKRKNAFISHGILDELDDLTESEQLELLKALLVHSRDNTDPQFEDRLMRNIYNRYAKADDENKQSYLETCESRRLAALEREEKKRQELEAQKAQQTTKSTIVQNDHNSAQQTTIVTDKDKDRDKDIKEKDPNGSKKKSSRFSAPTLEDTKTYFADKGFKSDPSAFHDYYTANGWTQGKGKPIKNWQAAANNWERRDRDFGRASPSPIKNTNPTFEQREFDEKAEKERRFRAMMKAAEDLNEQKAGSG